ncbi:MAG: hypothetical protein Q7S33_02905 [Nanoarchaeota archaeon]|nr:hypothetical protein [Nanoarchaeota archaeon]
MRGNLEKCIHKIIGFHPLAIDKCINNCKGYNKECIYFSGWEVVDSNYPKVNHNNTYK